MKTNAFGILYPQFFLGKKPIHMFGLLGGGGGGLSKITVAMLETTDQLVNINTRAPRPRSIVVAAWCHQCCRWNHIPVTKTDRSLHGKD